MAQFEVPQFIDLESKIVGPMTIKQFAFVAVAFLLSFFLFFVLKFVIWIPIAVILGSIGVAFAFIKVNGRPLSVIALLGIKFFIAPRLFIWKRPVVEEVISIPTVQRAKAPIEARRDYLKGALKSISSVSKLFQDLTTSKNPIPKREKVIPKKPISEIKEQFMVFKKISGATEVAKRIDYR